MNCPRCTHLLQDESDVARVVDTPRGIVCVVERYVATHVTSCPCGWSYTLASTQTNELRPRLIVIEGAA